MGSPPTVQAGLKKIDASSASHLSQRRDSLPFVCVIPRLGRAWNVHGIIPIERPAGGAPCAYAQHTRSRASKTHEVPIEMAFSLPPACHLTLARPGPASQRSREKVPCPSVAREGGVLHHRQGTYLLGKYICTEYEYV